MSLRKNKKGSNMYEWVSHMHSFLGGECQHKCRYCLDGKHTWKLKTVKYAPEKIDGTLVNTSVTYWDCTKCHEWSDNPKARVSIQQCINDDWRVIEKDEKRHEKQSANN